ncbi:hypothetical protein PoB_003540400 [Plakobranchus ocellatus]|uniref:Uncharacterized protein n=1 Tax=Plakobranchus ocellatus TaxID=259542 RepID=A0AAV4AMB0_9GAST|nr:hypothetical protein PoB_003540400 [Plakobranchus ocellatus]
MGDNPLSPTYCKEAVHGRQCATTHVLRTEQSIAIPLPPYFTPAANAIGAVILGSTAIEDRSEHSYSIATILYTCSKCYRSCDSWFYSHRGQEQSIAIPLPPYFTPAANAIGAAILGSTAIENRTEHSYSITIQTTKCTISNHIL